MRSDKQYPTKFLPGITTRKPQLRSNSWAKLLSQNRVNGEDNKKRFGLEISCTPVLFNLKNTRQTCQNQVRNLSNLSDEAEEGKLDILDEMWKTEGDKMSGKSFDDDMEDFRELKRSENDACSSLGDETKFPEATADQEKVKENRLPPLADVSSTKHEKMLQDAFYRRNSKGQKDCLPSKTKEDIDWQNIFVNGGFRPYEARDLPTRGELKLLKYKTWDPDGPLYCVTKCAKYFGLESEIDKAKLNPVEKEPRKQYTSPSPMAKYKFYPLQVPKRSKAFAPLKSSPETLTYLENPAKRYNLCNTCIVPPVTPASPMFRYSPIGCSPFPYKGRENILEELAEMSFDGQTTDEGICSPTDSELGL